MLLMPQQQGQVVYQIGHDDVIDYVNDAWGRFAIDNNAPSLSLDVLGTSLWDHIAGGDVAQIYRELIARARAKMAAITVPFRCDSPERYRKMRLEIAPLSAGRIEFRATLDSEGEYVKSVNLLRRTTGVKSESFLLICAWCKAVSRDGVWRPLEVVADELDLLLQESPPQLTHGICDVCDAEYRRTLGE
jgi:hypothetical protein